ncbi:MAG TPA: hypothetical protein DCW90_20430 [Lachnospiraceae bacterium]|nr:hypothetical protein [Lachnospiraceae bacterium]
MKFYYKEKCVCVNVKEALENATGDDYVDCIDAFGVVIHKEPGITIFAMYDTITDTLSVEATDSNDEITEIKENDLEMTDEERILLVNELKV